MSPHLPPDVEPYGDLMFNGSTKLVMWLLGIFGTLSAAGVMWVGTSLVSMEAKVASIDAKVDLIIEGRIREAIGKQ